MNQFTSELPFKLVIPSMINDQALALQLSVIGRQPSNYARGFRPKLLVDLESVHLLTMQGVCY